MKFSRYLFGNVSVGCNFIKKLQLFVFLFLLTTFAVLAQRQPPPMAARSAGSAGDHLIEAVSDTEKRLIDSYKKTADRLIGANEANEATRYLNKIAYKYWDKGHLQESAQFFKQSLQLTQQTNNINGLAMLNNNLGMIYSDNENYEKALEFFNAALAQRKKQKNKAGIVSSLINISNAYANMQQYNQAIKYLEEALPTAQEANDDRLVAQCYGTLAQIHQKAGNAEKSIYCFKFYASFEQRIQDAELRRREEQSQQKMQEVALHMKEIEAEKLAKEQELNSKADSLKKIDVALHDLEKRAAREAKTHQIMIDLLNKEEKIKELRLKEQENQLRYEAYIRYFILLMLAMMIGSAYFFYKSYKQKQKDHAKLAEQNVAIMRQAEELEAQRDNIEMQRTQLVGAFNEITDINSKITGSINYAKRIQTAMLPDAADLHELLPESFILFKPRDIVSGDYYWFTEVKIEKIVEKQVENVVANTTSAGFDLYDYGDYLPAKATPPSMVTVKETVSCSKILITAADCTGHGVPGALLTMIALNMLNDIVTVRNMTEADQILNELHKNVKKALKQDETDNRDGMDMALCVIDKAAKTMEFAGAKNPIVYIQNNELHYIKGDMHPIGGLQKEAQRIFQKHEISLAEPTTVYVFSDGYADQFSADNKKFTLRKFKDLLLQLHEKEMATQQKILDTTIEAWKGKSRQMDDILVMGFRIDTENSHATTTPHLTDNTSNKNGAEA